MNFSPDSKSMNFFGKLVDLVRINVLWLLCGFSLIGLYNLNVVEKIFAPFREAAEN